MEPHPTPLATHHADGSAGRIAYQDSHEGDDDPLVFIHGVNMAAEVWRDVIAQMVGMRRCIALDLRGHGASGRQGPFAIDNYIEDVEAVLVAARVDRAHLVGVSLGGMIACALAQRAPEGVTTVATFGSALRATHPDLQGGMALLREVGVRSYFERVMPVTTLPQGVAPDVQRALLAMATEGREDSAMVEQIIRRGFQTDISASIRPCERPVLVVTGEHDLTCGPAAGMEFAAAVGGRFKLVPDAGHVLPLERPDAVATIVREFCRAPDT